MNLLLRTYFSLTRNHRIIIKYIIMLLVCCLTCSGLWHLLKNYAIKQFISTHLFFVEYSLINLIVCLVFLIGVFFRQKTVLNDIFTHDKLEKYFENLETSGTELIKAVHQLQESENQCKMLMNVSKQLENEAILKRRLLRNIIDIVPMLIFAKNDLGQFIIVNKKVAEIYGCHPKELIGKTDADFNKNKEEVSFFLKQDQYVIEKNERVTCCEKITDYQGKELKLKTWKIPFLTDTNERAVLGVSMILEEN